MSKKLRLHVKPGNSLYNINFIYTIEEIGVTIYDYIKIVLFGRVNVCLGYECLWIVQTVKIVSTYSNVWIVRIYVLCISSNLIWLIATLQVACKSSIVNCKKILTGKTINSNVYWTNNTCGMSLMCGRNFIGFIFTTGKYTPVQHILQIK